MEIRHDKTHSTPFKLRSFDSVCWLDLYIDFMLLPVISCAVLCSSWRVTSIMTSKKTLSSLQIHFMRANCEWDILLPCNYSVHWTSPCCQSHITKILDLSSIQVMDVPALPKLEYQIQRKTNNSIIQEKYCHPTRNGFFPHRFLWIENREFLQNLISQSIWQKLGGNQLLFLFPAPLGFLQRAINVESDTGYHKNHGYGRKWGRLSATLTIIWK